MQTTLFHGLLVGVIIAAAPPSLDGQTPPERRADSALVRAMAEGLASEGLVGAVWATVHPDRGITLGAAGRPHAGRPAMLDPHAHVQVGSVTKTLVATGVLRLVTEGRLRLDAPVSQLLPKIAIRNPWEATHPVLLRHLMDHTSGLDDARLWQLFNAEPRPDTPLEAGFDADRLRLVVRYPPGERFSYSNTGYGLLALVIEAVTASRYEPYLDAHLLTPLGMTSSTFEFVTQSAQTNDFRLAMGHFEEGALAPAIPTYLRPAMQFTTTAADMARFAQFLMGNGVIGGSGEDSVGRGAQAAPFIRADLLQAMGTPVGTEAARAGLPVGYGLGLSTRDRFGTLGRCHGGNTVGYRAMFCVYPQEKKAFFISMNADNEDANYVRLDSMVIATLGLTKASPPPRRPGAVDARMWDGFYVPSPARFEMFRYLDVTMDFVRVDVVGGDLRIAPFQGTALTLEPVGGALYRAPSRTLPSHVLIRTSSGSAAVSDGLRTWERVSVVRLISRWASLAAGILGLTLLLLLGTTRGIRRRLSFRDPLFAPYLVVIGLLITTALLTRQSVLALGDTTLVNQLIALLTFLLPASIVFGLWRVWQARRAGRGTALDGIVLLAALQWCLVLAVFDLIPLVMWG